MTDDFADEPNGDNAGTTAARIIDRGYRRFEGTRTGARGAIRSVAWNGLRAVLGLGRAARHKILPIVTATMAFVPAIVFVGLAVLLPSDILDPGEIASYADYYGFIVAALLLFTAFVAPDALTADRRSGMLALYLSTPLTRTTYLAARSVAVVGTLLVVTVGPPVFLLIGYSFEGAGPDGFDGWLGILWRAVASGVLIALVYGGVSLALSSFTERRAVASASIVLFILIDAALIAALVEAADYSQNLFLLNILSFPFELVYRIYGEAGPEPEISTAGLWAATTGWIVVSWGTAWWRYQRIKVDR